MRLKYAQFVVRNTDNVSNTSTPKRENLIFDSISRPEIEAAEHVSAASTDPDNNYCVRSSICSPMGEAPAILDASITFTTSPYFTSVGDLIKTVFSTSFEFSRNTPFVVLWLKISVNFAVSAV